MKLIIFPDNAVNFNTMLVVIIVVAQLTSKMSRPTRHEIIYSDHLCDVITLRVTSRDLTSTILDVETVECDWLNNPN